MALLLSQPYFFWLIVVALLSGIFIVLVWCRRTKHIDHLGDTVHSFLAALGSGYLGLDAAGNIVASNKAYEQLVGVTRRELIGKHIKELISPDESWNVHEELKKIEQLRSATFFSRHRCSDGSWIPLEVTVTAMQQNPAFICLYRDLSKEMAALEANRHSIDLLRYVVEHTQSAVAVFDNQMHYLFVSDKYYDEYNLDTEVSIVGKEHYEVIPDIPDRWREIHKRALSGEVISEEDDPYIRESGQTDYTKWECRPWYAQDGVIGGMVLYTENITARKRFEEELREARDYLSTLIERASGPIVALDDTFTIVRANTAFASLFDMRVEDMIGMHIKSFEEYVSKDEKSGIMALLERQERIESIEIPIKQRDGSWKVVLWTSSVITDPKTQAVVTTIAQGQDITDRKRIEQEHIDQLELLERWYAVMTHREDRVIELKVEVNELLSAMGRPERYQSVKEWEQ